MQKMDIITLQELKMGGGGGYTVFLSNQYCPLLGDHYICINYCPASNSGGASNNLSVEVKFVVRSVRT